MDLGQRFCRWIAGEIGSAAPLALRRHLRDHGYRLVSFTESEGRLRWDVYHPSRGFFQGTGETDLEALLEILRQVWLVEALSDVKQTGIGL